MAAVARWDGALGQERGGGVREEGAVAGLAVSCLQLCISPSMGRSQV
jgi:hypothetical protein